MGYENNRGRLPLPLRHQEYLKLLDLNHLIALQTELCQETHSEKALLVLQGFIAVRDGGVAYEEWCRSDEVKEFFDNPGAYPHAVQTWMFYYREKDMQ